MGNRWFNQNKTLPLEDSISPEDCKPHQPILSEFVKLKLLENYYEGVRLEEDHKKYGDEYYGIYGDISYSLIRAAEGYWRVYIHVYDELPEYKLNRINGVIHRNILPICNFEYSSPGDFPMDSLGEYRSAPYAINDICKIIDIINI